MTAKMMRSRRQRQMMLLIVIVIVCMMLLLVRSNMLGISDSSISVTKEERATGTIASSNQETVGGSTSATFSSTPPDTIGGNVMEITNAPITAASAIEPSSQENHNNHSAFSLDHLPLGISEKNDLPLSPPPLPTLSTEQACNVHEGDDDFRLRSGVFVIVTGLEHTGTTMAGSLLRSVPNLYGAFECGLLLPEEPANIKTVVPFYDWLSMPVISQQWGLPVDHRDKLLTAQCHAEQFSILRKYSPLMVLHNSSWIVDKTPRYYRNLLSIMDRTPKVPVVVTWKEPSEVIKSFEKRHGQTQIGVSFLEHYQRELRLSLQKYPERIFIMNQTEFGQDPDAVMTKMFAFLGLKWDPSYKTMAALNAKGAPLNIKPIPPFNLSRVNCKDCKAVNPYEE